MFQLFDVWKGEKKATSRDAWALAGANVVVPSGRKIALLGANAAHNSTVLRLLSGVEEPDKGAIRRSGVACWPFDYSGFSDNSASVRQNANFLGRIYGVDAEEVARIAGALSGVRVIRGKSMRAYHGSDRRALELGLTLAIQFDWYFVDERLPRPPDETEAAVDAAIADRIGRASVLWATTNPRMLNGFCDAGLVLDQGVLTFYNGFDEAVQAYRELTQPQPQPERKVRKQDDGQPDDGAKRERRAARRARKNGSEEPV